MQWLWAGEDATISVDFEIDGNPVVPTMVSAVLRGPDGLVMFEPWVEDGTTTAMVEIPAEYLDRTTLADYEMRTLIVTHSGPAGYTTQSYPLLLTEWVPLTVTPTTVRNLLGVDPQELPDRDVDLLTAYFDIKPRLNTLLTTKDNLAIALRAALNISSSFDLRFMQTRRSEDATVARQTVDFAALRARLDSQLGDLLEEISPQTYASSAIFVLSNPTDAITG